MTAPGFKLAESINKAGFDYTVEAGSFFVGEACVFAVGFGVGQVDVFVRDIEIATEYHGFFLFQLAHEFQEILIPLVFPVVQAEQFPFGVRRVNGDQENVLKLGGQDATFGVVFGYAHAGKDGQWSAAGEKGGAAVTAFEGRVPDHGVAGDVEVHLVGQGADFLQADDVGIATSDEFFESFFQAGAEAVDVPGDQFHGLGVLSFVF